MDGVSTKSDIKVAELHTEWLVAADYDGIQQIRVIHVKRCIVVSFSCRFADSEGIVSIKISHPDKQIHTFEPSIVE